MKAIVFAAGLGTRLGKITASRPKALLEVGGITLLEQAIRKLIRNGFGELIINIHHFGEQITRFVSEHRDFGIRIVFSDESDQLLETGGGLMKASWFFDDHKPFLTWNVDVLTSLDLTALYRNHLQTGALATLACKQRNTRRYFLTDEENQLCGWENTLTGERIESGRGTGELVPVAFSGISIIDPAIFTLVKEEGSFSLTPLFVRLSKDHRISIYRHDRDFWMDIGKPGQLEKAGEYFRERDILSL